MIRDGGVDQTPSKIAAELNVSLRTLELGFRAVHECMPKEFLRKVHIDKARQALLAPNAATSVTDFVLANGFLRLARFSAHYQQVFGELPVQTLRRSKPKRANEAATAFRHRDARSERVSR